MSTTEITLLALLIASWVFSLVRTQLHREHLKTLSADVKALRADLDMTDLQVASLLDALAVAGKDGRYLDWAGYRRARAINEHVFYTPPTQSRQ